MKKRIVCLFVLSFINSCSNEHPEGILSEKDYEKVLIELRIISEYNLITSDSVRARLLTDSIFRYYDINEDVFKKSHEWYEKDAKAHAARLSRLADSLSILDTRISTPGN